MKVVKATKLFRQISLIGALVFALVSVGLLATDLKDCPTANLRASISVIFALWSTIFVLMLVQVTGLGRCLKDIPKLLFAFYFFICAVMLFVQMEVWGGYENRCRTQAPVFYWWLIVQIVVFYLIVTFGLATWGSYLCQVADAQEELTKQAVEEYLRARHKLDKMKMRLNQEDDNEPLLQLERSQY